MKAKKLIPSVMTTLMSLSLISGATYSLFTSQSTHDITVSSGTVKVTSELGNLKLFSMGEAQTGTFANGGTAVINEGKTLELVKVTPGDKATFDVTIDNLSTVIVKYRVRCFLKEGNEDLFSKLNITSPATDWSQLDPGTEQSPSTVTKNVSIELDKTADNNLQDKNLVIGIVVEAIQGNVSNDVAKVNSLNGILAKKELAGTKNVKVGDVLADLNPEGVKVEDLTLKDTGNEIVWDQASDRFAILNAEEVTYPYNFGDVTKSNLWKFVDAKTYVDNSLYSQYLKDDVYTKLDLNLKAGLDVGNNDEQFNFTLNTEEANAYTVASNHKESKLTIDSANASVSHYGLLGESDVKNVAMHSYHEFGQTRLVSVVKGKINVEPEAIVKVLAAKPVLKEDVVIKKEETAIIKTAVKTTDVEIVSDTKLEVVTPETVEKKVTSAINQETAAEEGYDLLIEEEGKLDIKTSLAEFRDEVNLQKGTYDKSTVNVVRDIDLGGVKWTPIGGWNHCYHGTFNGNFYTISNFNISENRRAAFFGRIGLDGLISDDPVEIPLENVYNKETHTLVDRKESDFDTVIKNLVLDKVHSETKKGIPNIHSGYDAYGVLVGRAYNSKISNITVNNSVVEAHCKAGGIAGIAVNTTIENCNVNNSKIMSNYNNDSNNVGGLVGYASGDVITNCVNNSEVYCSGKALCAGIAAFTVTRRYLVLNNVINRGSVISENCSVAGIIGGNSGYFYLNNVTNEGDLKVLKDTFVYEVKVGGIGSYLDGACFMQNVLNKGNIYTKIVPNLVGYIFAQGSRYFTYDNVKNTGKYFLNDVEKEATLLGNEREFNF